MIITWNKENIMGRYDILLGKKPKKSSIPAFHQEVGRDGWYRDDPESIVSDHDRVVRARRAEDKALKCLEIADRLLPKLSKFSIENQAADFMFLSDRIIDLTLRRVKNNNKKRKKHN
jgi:hypothetical protein